MKHNAKIVAILLGMFIITQFIGIYVVNYYQSEGNELPLWLQNSEPQNAGEYSWVFSGIVVAFIIAVFLLFFLTKFNVDFVMKLWFFIVVIVSLQISFKSFFPEFYYSSLILFLVAIPLAFIKIYKRTFVIHNLTELLIYPGIAAVFVPLLNMWTAFILLILISIYDMWAVWHSGIMQKMAKYQINNLKIFAGFFVPYISKKVRLKLKKLTKAQRKKKKVKINVAILGGGDVVFPIIISGVMLKTFGLTSALFVIAGAFVGLTGLFLYSQKKKFYPAMPFISAGIFLGLGSYWLLF